LFFNTSFVGLDLSKKGVSEVGKLEELVVQVTKFLLPGSFLGIFPGGISGLSGKDLSFEGVDKSDNIIDNFLGSFWELSGDLSEGSNKWGEGFELS